ncbi:MAG: nucleotidyltransferase family protein [Deltaproteobacteria bacterium]|jgi:predicted nucleotidyltransferase|nr:nucleotidyltransferase family protein [Deltaproteobacteria bacterium]
MEKKEIIKILKWVEDEARQRYKAQIRGIFGSYVREEENDKSDLDVLVEFEEEANLLHLVGLSLFLEEKLHLPVDVVPYDSVREEIRSHVLKEAIYL